MKYAEKRPVGRTEQIRWGAVTRSSNVRRFLIGCNIFGLAAASWLLGGSGEVPAQPLLQISGARRAGAVPGPGGKTAGVSGGSPFSGVSIGDPDVAGGSP